MLRSLKTFKSVVLLVEYYYFESEIRQHIYDTLKTGLEPVLGKAKRMFEKDQDEDEDENEDDIKNEHHLRVEFWPIGAPKS